MKWFILLCVVFIFPIANAELTFEDLKQKTEHSQVLEGEFIQKKYLQALDTSIVSSGYFIYKKNKNVHWVTVEPIANELVMTPTSLISRQGEYEFVNIDVQNSPAAAMLNKVLFSLLVSEWDVLDKLFRLSGKFEGDNWYITLIPVDETVLQLVEKVELVGSMQLHRMTFFERSGNQTTIKFTYLTDS